MRYLAILLIYPLLGILALGNIGLAAGLFVFTNIFRPLEFAYMPGTLPLAHFVLFVLLGALIIGLVQQKIVLRFNVVFWCCLTFLCWSFISAFTSPFFPQTIAETVDISKHILPLAVISIALGELKSIKLYLVALVSAIAIWGVRFGITCLTTMTPSIYMYIYGGQQPDNNDFAAALASYLPLILFAALRYSGRFKMGIRGLSWLVFALSIVQLAFSASRGAAVSIIVNILIYLLFISPKKLRDSIFVVIIAVPTFLLLPQTFYERMGTIELGVEQTESSAQARVHHMHSTLRCAIDHPVLGIGPMSYINVSRQYSGRNPTQPHNMWLKIAAELGFVGLFIYVFMVWMVIHGLMRVYKDALFRGEEWSEWAGLALALITGIIGYSCAQTFLNHYQLETYWGLLAAGNALYRIYWEKVEQNDILLCEEPATIPDTNQGCIS